MYCIIMSLDLIFMFSKLTPLHFSLHFNYCMMFCYICTLSNVNQCCLRHLLAFLICWRLVSASIKSACLIVIVLYTFTRFFLLAPRLLTASLTPASFCASFVDCHRDTKSLSFLPLSFFVCFLSLPSLAHFATVMLYGYVHDKFSSSGRRRP